MTKGIVFSNERQSNPTDIEDKIRQVAYSYIQSGQFLNMNQRNLAGLIVYQVRQDLKVTEIWNDSVEFYTQLGTYDVYTIVKEMKRNASRTLPSKKLVLKHSISSVSSSTVSFSSYSTLSRTNSSMVEAINIPRQAITSVIG